MRRKPTALILSLFFAFSALFGAAAEGDSSLSAGNVSKKEAENAPAERPRKAALIVLEGDVDAGMAAYAARAVRNALEGNPDLIVFEVNTYGGRLDAAFDISDTLLAVPVPTVALVDKKAISAGALISLSARKLYMRPSTTIGDCAPIAQGSEGPIMLGEKIQSPLRARFRTLAEKNGYPSLLSQAMVSSELEVVELSKGDSSRLLLRREVDELPARETAGWTRKTLVSEGELLTLTDAEAERLGFSEGTVADVGALMKKLGVETWEEVEISWSETLARFLGTIAPLLMLIGFGALYQELHTPGFGVFGIVGIAALLLVFGAQHVAGLADNLPLALLLLGAALLALEILVFPGTWVAGSLALVCMVAAMALTVGEPTPVLPDEPLPAVDADRLLRNLSAVLVPAALALLLPLLLGRAIVRWMPDRTGIAPGTTLEGARSPTQRALPAPGERGKAVTLLRPVGRVRFGDRVLEATAANGYVEAGSEVVVESAEGDKLTVSAVEKEDA